MAKKAGRPEPVPEEIGRSASKRRAIIDAATEVFLKGGYLGTNMDEIATLSGVSKQTVYKHFASKEALFVEIVGSMTSDAGDRVHNDAPDLPPDGDLAAYLEDYAYLQLSIVLTPQVMQLRRLVIGEVGRFPELARVLYERGPLRAIGILAAMFERLAARGLLRVDDARLAASHFNWLVMSHALNEAMLLGDAAIPRPADLRRQAAAGVKVFLAAYGKR
ncbi:MAG: TetR/AcrR family transcriptional regulator [Devosia sp.]|uniref:TetR/AcrR family transcriptional regulator n=1 Tax=Devosia sp. TaxID=1871048 RepID=UPI001A38DE43|nr:TetR/AcrR family transcriptional regulator [Devosia sp.]MBL8598862.1 TetR/AcrR family transcriptional regulator [Devosia sp.]